MNNTIRILAAAAILAAAPAMAGSAGTWIGNGATVFGALGSTVTYDRSAEGVVLAGAETEVFGMANLSPGTVAVLMLTPEQAAALLDEMSKINGTSVSADGNAASAPVTLTSGGTGTLLVNSVTGRVLLISL